MNCNGIAWRISPTIRGKRSPNSWDTPPPLHGCLFLVRESPWVTRGPALSSDTSIHQAKNPFHEDEIYPGKLLLPKSCNWNEHAASSAVHLCHSRLPIPDGWVWQEKLRGCFLGMPWNAYTEINLHTHGWADKILQHATWCNYMKIYRCFRSTCNYL